MPVVLKLYAVLWRSLVVVLLSAILLFGWHVQRPLRRLAWRLDSISGDAAVGVANAREATAALNGKHGVRELLRAANVVTVQLGRTANQVRLASVEERTQAKAAGEGLIAAIGKFDALLDDTSESLNGEGGVLVELATDLKKTGTVLDQVGGEKGLVATATASMQAAGDTVTGLQPELQRATTNVANMAEHGSGAVANVQEATGIVRDSLKPKKVGFWGRMANAVMPTMLRGVLNAFFPERVKVVNEVSTTGAKQ